MSFSCPLLGSMLAYDFVPRCFKDDGDVDNIAFTDEVNLFVPDPVT